MNLCFRCFLNKEETQRQMAMKTVWKEKGKGGNTTQKLQVLSIHYIDNYNLL